MKCSVCSSICCHLVLVGTSTHGADVVGDVRRCVDDHLEKELIGASYVPSSLSTAAAMLAADFDHSGRVGRLFVRVFVVVFVWVGFCITKF